MSACAALHHAKGELPPGETIVIESITGSTMSVRAIEAVKFGPHDAVIPEVGGSAAFTGRHEFWFDPADSFRGGFIFR